MTTINHTLPSCATSLNANIAPAAENIANHLALLALSDYKITTGQESLAESIRALLIDYDVNKLLISENMIDRVNLISLFAQDVLTPIFYRGFFDGSKKISASALHAGITKNSPDDVIKGMKTRLGNALKCTLNNAASHLTDFLENANICLEYNGIKAIQQKGKSKGLPVFVVSEIAEETSQLPTVAPVDAPADDTADDTAENTADVTTLDSHEVSAHIIELLKGINSIGDISDIRKALTARSDEIKKSA